MKRNGQVGRAAELPKQVTVDTSARCQVSSVNMLLALEIHETTSQGSLPISAVLIRQVPME
jgi:hypothetical protein